MNHRILLVEDDLLTAEFMSLYLQGEGHEVRSAHSMRQALEGLDVFSPSLLITDINLTDGNGAELAGICKQRGVPHAIAISGVDATHLRAQSVDISALDQMLVKPVELTDLAAVIAGL